jgi:hypothetical protein
MANSTGMRKAQDFIVYPMKEATTRATIQSDTRIGQIDLETGKVMLSPARKGGSYFVHLAFAAQAGKLDAEQLLMFKAEIMGTASGMAGTNRIVYTDNSGALEVFNS